MRGESSSSSSPCEGVSQISKEYREREGEGYFRQSVGTNEGTIFIFRDLRRLNPDQLFSFAAKCNFVSLPPPEGDNKTKGAFAFRNQKMHFLLCFAITSSSCHLSSTAKKSVSQNLR